MPFVQFIRIFVLTALVNSSSLFDAHSIRKPPTSLSLTFSRRRRRRRHCRRHLLQHGAAGHLSNMTLTALSTSLPPFCCCCCSCSAAKGRHTLLLLRSPLPAHSAGSPHLPLLSVVWLSNDPLSSVASAAAAARDILALLL